MQAWRRTRVNDAGIMAPKQRREEKSNAPRKPSVGRNGELKECWRYLNEPAHYVDGAF